MATMTAIKKPIIKASLEDFFNRPISAGDGEFTLAELWARPRARGGSPEEDAKRRQLVDALDHVHRIAFGEGMRK